jgi:hypothetical protein
LRVVKKTVKWRYWYINNCQYHLVRVIFQHKLHNRADYLQLLIFTTAMCARERSRRL